MSDISSPLVHNEREIQPMNLSLEQLNSLKTQHEEDILDLQKQLETLISAKSRFSSAKSSLLEMNTCNLGNKMLVPLNSSLYVPGEIAETNKVIVELGTGYFCEKSVDGAIDLINRKTQLVNKSIESVENIQSQKRKTLEQIIQIMQFKMSKIQSN